MSSFWGCCKSTFGGAQCSCYRLDLESLRQMGVEFGTPEIIVQGIASLSFSSEDWQDSGAVVAKQPSTLNPKPSTEKDFNHKP